MEKPRGKSFGKKIREAIILPLAVIGAIGGAPSNAQSMGKESIASGFVKFENEHTIEYIDVKKFLEIKDVTKQYKILRRINFADNNARGKFFKEILPNIHPYLRFIISQIYTNNEHIINGTLQKKVDEEMGKENINKKFLDTISRVYEYFSTTTPYLFENEQEKTNSAVLIGKNIYYNSTSIDYKNVLPEVFKLEKIRKKYLNYSPLKNANIFALTNPENKGFVPMFNNVIFTSRLDYISKKFKNIIPNLNEDGGIEIAMQSFLYEIENSKGKSVFILSGHGLSNGAGNSFYPSENLKLKITPQDIADALFKKYELEDARTFAQNNPDTIIGNFCFSANFANELAEIIAKKNKELKSYQIPEILFISSTEENEVQMVNMDFQPNFFVRTFMNGENIQQIIKNLMTTFGKGAVKIIGGERKQMQIGESNISDKNTNNV